MLVGGGAGDGYRWFVVSDWLSACTRARAPAIVGPPVSWTTATGPRSLQHRDLQLFVFQPDLHRLAVQFLRNVFQHLVVAGDGDQFGVERTTEDTCLFVALRAGQRAAAQGAVDVYRAVGDDLRAGADRGQHGQVAVVGVDLLARAHGSGLDDAGLAGGGGAGPGFRLGRSGGSRDRLDRKRTRLNS